MTVSSPFPFCLASGALLASLGACSASFLDGSADAAAGQELPAELPDQGGDAGRSCPKETLDSGACVLSVEGTVGDLDGNAIPPSNVTVCGRQKCFGARSDVDGHFRVEIGGSLDLSAYRIHLDPPPDYAGAFASFDGLSGPNVTLPRPLRTVRLPASGVELVSGGPPAEARSAAVTLRVEGRTELAFGYRNDSDRINGTRFRAVTVDPLAAPEWHDDVIVVAMGLSVRLRVDLSAWSSTCRSRQSWRPSMPSSSSSSWMTTPVSTWAGSSSKPPGMFRRTVVASRRISERGFLVSAG